MDPLPLYHLSTYSVFFARLHASLVPGACHGMEPLFEAPRGSPLLVALRTPLQDATDKFGKELPGIWQEYVDFEIQEGDVKRANAVRWRSQQR